MSSLFSKMSRLKQIIEMYEKTMKDEEKYNMEGTINCNEEVSILFNVSRTHLISPFENKPLNLFFYKRVQIKPSRFE